jgi:hypothetical protein
MSHHRLSPEERRLFAREGAGLWDFAHQREFHWLALLYALASLLSLYFTVRLWLNGAELLP